MEKSDILAAIAKIDELRDSASRSVKREASSDSGGSIDHAQAAPPMREEHEQAKAAAEADHHTHTEQINEATGIIESSPTSINPRGSSVNSRGSSDQITLAPRQYQLEAISAVHKAFAKGVRRPLVALPTGTGKTVVFAHLLNQRNGRALVLAHRDELIEQAAEKIRLISPAAQIGIVKGERNEIDAQTVLASVQTLSRKTRLRQLAKDFQTIIVDEAHHATADTYQRVLKYFRAFERKNPPLTLGITATPERSDRVGLKSVFQKIVYSRSLLEMIAQHYLADLRSLRVQLDVDFNQLQIRQGDFIESEVSQLLSNANAPQHIVNAVRQHAADRKALVFAPGVALAHQIAACLQESGIAGEAIDGNMNMHQRRAILARLRAGQTKVVVNCMVLTEGFDEPSVDCIVLARPTRSQPFYIQMAGRGTRLHPGKQDCLIIDLVGATERYDLVTLASLFGLPPDKLSKSTVLKAVEEQAREKEAEQAARAAERSRFARERANRQAAYQEPVIEYAKYEYVRQARQIHFHWLSINPSRFVLSPGQGLLILQQRADEQWDVIWRLPDRSSKPLAFGLTLNYAQGVAEDCARQVAGEILVDSQAPWRQQPASEKQISLLQRLGCLVHNGMTKGQASDLISIRFASDDLWQRN